MNAMNTQLREILELVRKAKRSPGEELPVGATADQIEHLEQALGFCVPEELKVWLACCNGPCVGPGGIAGVQTKRKAQDIEALLGNFPKWKRLRWIPVAGDGSGNYYVMTTEGDHHPIIFVDTMEDAASPAYVVASNLWFFFIFYLERDAGKQGWPFQREIVTMKDPNISRHGDFRLPWET